MVVVEMKKSYKCKNLKTCDTKNNGEMVLTLGLDVERQEILLFSAVLIENIGLALTIIQPTKISLES